MKRKFLLAVFNIVLVAAVVCSVTFGFMWDSARSAQPDVPNDDSAIVLTLQKKIETLENDLAIMNAKLKKSESDKHEVYVERNKLTSRVGDLEAYIEILEEEKLASLDTISTLESMVENLKLQIAQLNAQLENAEQEALVTRLTPVEFQLTPEQVAISYRKTVPLEEPDSHGNTEQTIECQVSSYLRPSGSGGRFKTVKEAYVVDDDLVLITEWTLPTNPNLTKLAYSRIAFEYGSDLINTLTTDTFLAKIEEDFNNDAHEVNIKNVIEFANQASYGASSTSQTAVYMAAHQEDRFEIYGHNLGLNEFSFMASLGTSTLPANQIYMRYNILFYINEKPVVYLDMPICLRADAPTTESGLFDSDAAMVMLLEQLRVDEQVDEVEEQEDAA